MNTAMNAAEKCGHQEYKSHPYMFYCKKCQVRFSKTIKKCPVCGYIVGPPEKEGLETAKCPKCGGSSRRTG